MDLDVCVFPCACAYAELGVGAFGNVLNVTCLT